MAGGFHTPAASGWPIPEVIVGKAGAIAMVFLLLRMNILKYNNELLRVYCEGHLIIVDEVYNAWRCI